MEGAAYIRVGSMEQLISRRKACVYLRASTNDGTSIAKQLEALMEVARREGYEVVMTYEDVSHPGSYDPQKGLTDLLSDAKAGAEWPIVLCYACSRISRRSAMETTHFVRVLRETGKRVHTFSEGLLDSDSLLMCLMMTHSAITYQDWLRARARKRGNKR